MIDKDETTQQETQEQVKQSIKRGKKEVKAEVDIDALIERVYNLEQCVVRLANVAGAKQFADKYNIKRVEDNG